jgi:hypothetical protein
LRASGPEIMTRPARVNGVLAHPPVQPSRLAHLPSSRAAIAAGVLLLCSVGLGACGGGGSVSDAVPKSTPDIIPPTDTSAEKAAVQTTSTSTSSTSKTSTGESSEGSGEESESSEEAASSGGSESGASESNGESAGGTSSETAKSEETAKGGGSESAATPSGGASAPTGK